jgi:putative hydrolase of the HAD superfamily
MPKEVRVDCKNINTFAQLYPKVSRPNSSFQRGTMFKAVYFDLDNTLVDRNASIDAFSILFLRNFNSELHNESAQHIAEVIKRVDNGGYLPANSRYQKISEALGFELQRQLNWRITPAAADITSYWRREFSKQTVEMDGAYEVITALHHSGFYLGIISNGAEATRQSTLAATSFVQLFSQVVSSEQFGVKKPNTSIFTETVKAAGFKPEQCFYVGDHPINDVQGALDAGMMAILLAGHHPGTLIPEQAMIINHLSEIIRLVE